MSAFALRLALASIVLVGCVDVGEPEALKRCGNSARCLAPTDAGAVRGDARAAATDGAGASVSDAAADAPVLVEGLPFGLACTSASVCASGLCVDGVCCRTACVGSCFACNVPGRMGDCTAVALGRDPDNECPADPARSCGRDGTCDGQGACGVYPVGTLCEPGGCSGQNESAARTCDGSGLCRPAATKRCDPYVCNGPVCGTTCSGGVGCAPSSSCDNANMRCSGLRAAGASCTNAGDCSSGLCGDGVCCQTACTGLCQACNIAGAQGSCVPVAAGTDPANECAVEAPTACGRDGTCDGMGACRLAAVGTLCATPVCADAVAKAPRTCNGTGTCSAPSTVTCGPYLCAATECATTCSGPNGCGVGFACGVGQCRDLRAGLVGYWKFDEAKGTIAMDSSGNGNHARLTGGGTPVAATFPGAKFPNANALAFDGVNNFVQVTYPVSGILDFDTGSFSLSLWVYVRGNTSDYDMPLEKGGASLGNPGYAIELGRGAWTMRVQDPEVGVEVEFSSAPLLNQWVHLVGVRNAATGLLQAYRNGVFVQHASAPPGAVVNARPLTFGAQGFANYLFMGSLDDVRIFNRALTADDVAALYAEQ